MGKLLYPAFFIGCKMLYDNYNGKFFDGENGKTLFEQLFDHNFVVKASFVPTYPLPENAEYAGQLSCDDQTKRRRVFLVHMYNGPSKKLLDTHREFLCKYKVDKNSMLIYCPSLVQLNYVNKTYPKGICLGLQNFYPKDEGNYTGEVSLPMIKDMGVSYVLVGSNHRRLFLGETNKFVAAKVKRVLLSNMKCVIFLSNVTGGCEECETEGCVVKQMDAILPNIHIEDWENVIFACEPPKCEGVEQYMPEAISAAQRMCKLVRDKIADKVGDEVAQRVSIIYSGDICHGTAPIYMAQDDIDGIAFCPKYDSECFINIINSGLLLDKRREELKQKK